MKIMRPVRQPLHLQLPELLSHHVHHRAVPLEPHRVTKPAPRPRRFGRSKRRTQALCGRLMTTTRSVALVTLALALLIAVPVAAVFLKLTAWVIKILIIEFVGAKDS